MSSGFLCTLSSFGMRSAVLFHKHIALCGMRSLHCFNLRLQICTSRLVSCVGLSFSCAQSFCMGDSSSVQRFCMRAFQLRNLSNRCLNKCSALPQRNVD